MKNYFKIIKNHLVVPSLGFALLFYIFDIIVDVYVFKEGTIKTHLLSPHPLEIYYRSIVALMFIAFGFIGHNMTRRRKKTEETLKIAEDKFKIVAENTYDWEFWTGPDRRFIFTSPSSIRVTGYSPQKFNEDPDFLDSIIYPEDISVYEQHRKEAELEHGLHEVEFRINHADGSVRWIGHVCQPVTGLNGEHLGIRGNNRDITARKKMQLEIEESEAKYSSLFSSMLNGFAWHKIITDENGHPVDYEFLEINDAFERMTGLKREGILHKLVSEVIPELKNDDFDWIGTYGRVALNNEKIQFEQYSKNFGKWFNITAYSPAQGEFATIFEDITERKKIEQVNWENQERLDVIFNSIQAGIVVIDRETHNISYVNQMAAKMIGAPQDEIMDHPCHKFICPVEAGACPITDLGQTVDNSEKCLLTMAGEKIPILKTVVEEELAGRKVLVESFVDISERKKMEADLQFRNVLLTTQQEASIDGILVVDENAKIVSYNQRFVKMWGIPSELIKQNDDQPLFEFVANSIVDITAFLDRVKYLYDNKQETCRDEIILKDGRVFDRYSAPMTGSDGLYYGRVWYFHDISERVTQGKEIKEQALFFETLIDTILNPVFYKDTEGKYLGCNKAFEELLGVPKEKITGKTVFELTPPDKAAQYNRMDMELLKNGGIQTYEYPVKSAKQGLREMQFNKSIFKDALGESKGIVGVMMDITERKLMENQIKQSEEKYRNLVENQNEGIGITDENEVFTFANPAADKIFGLGKGKLEGRSLKEFILPQNIKQVTDQTQQRKDGKQSYYELEINADTGEKKTIYISAIPQIDSTGKFLGTMGIFQDITERKQAEEALRESKERFQSYIENAPYGVFIADEKGRYIQVNPAACQITGYAQEELLALSMPNLIPPEAQEAAGNHFRQVVETGKASGEFAFRHKNGNTRYWSVDAVKLSDTRFMGFVEDITERKKAEKLQDVLYHISEASVKSDDLKTLYGEIHKTVRDLISARNFYIALYHEKEDMLSFPYFVDEVDPAPQPRKLANGLTEYVLKTGTPLLASPVVLSLLIEQGKVSMVGTPAIDWAGVPLKVGNKTLGVLVVQSYQEDVRFGAEDLSMLNFVSDNIAQAIIRKNDEEERKKLVSDLRKLSAAIEQSTSVIVIADLDGNIEYVNPVFEKVTGYKMTEVLGKNPRILKSGELPAEEYKRLWETIISGGEWRGQFHNKRKDGSLYWEQAAISGIRDAEGKIVKYLAVKEDITERKLMMDDLKASEAQNRALVDSAGRAGEAIVMLQNSGNIQVACLVANQEAVRITGYSQDELKRISWLDLVHPRFREDAQKRSQARLHNEEIPGIYEITIVSKYGVEIPIEVTGSPMQYQGRPAIVGFFREISERKQAELEREAMIKDLKEALANIKQLKGLIPICASCKKIRNDGGYWQQVEEYVADHTDADFSHGLCDECAHKLYPDYFQDKKNKTDGEEV